MTERGVNVGDNLLYFRGRGGEGREVGDNLSVFCLVHCGRVGLCSSKPWHNQGIRLRL